MPRFHLKQTSRHLSSHAGMSLIGQFLEAAQLNLLDGRFPTSQGMRTLDIVEKFTGLLSLSKSDSEAIEAFRTDHLFKPALNPGQSFLERLVAPTHGTVGGCTGRSDRA